MLARQATLIGGEGPCNRLSSTSARRASSDWVQLVELVGRLLGATGLMGMATRLRLGPARCDPPHLRQPDSPPFSPEGAQRRFFQSDLWVEGNTTVPPGPAPPSPLVQ